jgi:hypothetical protein
MDTSWYDKLRNEYRPKVISILLIGESPPDPDSGNLRFFYSSELTYDNLYRGVAKAAYGDDIDIDDKVRILSQLKRDGFWLIDAVDQPVNKLKSSDRQAIITSSLPELLRKCLSCAPQKGAIICHGLVYELVASELRKSGIRVLHDNPLPFPLGNWRKRFTSGFRECLICD